MDVGCSCVVQAPAGSGKTTLLVERVLRVLAVVDSPDAILVLTFTNKAAAHMLERIAERLELDDSPLVKRVRQRDQQLGWGLMENLSQLRVQTIDGFCCYLVQKLLPSQTFSRIVQGMEAGFYYQLAVQRWLLDRSELVSTQVLLQHVGFNYHQLVQFLVRMLARRDCWLSHLLSLDTDCLRKRMEMELTLINNELKDDCCFPQELFTEWQQLYRATVDFYTSDDLSDHQWRLLQRLWAVSTWKELGVEDARELASWLLTKEYQWRQRLTSEQGIIQLSLTGALAKAWKGLKARWQTWQRQLMQQERLLIQLQEFMAAPPTGYSDDQWQVVSAILASLPSLVAYLQLVWREEQLVDYTEVTVRAIQALDPELNESEQTFRQLFRWQHLLVDEFQDTSLLHFNLLHKLTNDWSAEECSIFLVGDPMQSIYRFRQAEVGIFLWVKRHGMGGIRLTNLTLSSNFRATRSLINWINQHFSLIFPPSSNIATGAINYVPSIAQYENDLSTIDIIAIRDQNTIVQCIVELQASFPGQSVAVLAQTRRQLLPIMTALDGAGIAYQALELEGLLSDATAKKFWALMRLVLAPNQRWSWYNWWLTAYNSAPPPSWDHGWQNSDDDYRMFLSDALVYGVPNLLQPDQVRRWLLGVEDLLNSTDLDGVSNRQLWTVLVRRCVLGQGEWSEQQLAILQVFDELWILAETLDVNLLESKLLEMYLPTTINSDICLQLMTMHKAKGLEFDHVIIPELNGVGRNDERAVLVWQERLREQGGSDLLMASGLSRDEELYNYIVRSERLKTRYELIRLFYVAVTRARMSLRMLVSNMDQPVVGSLWEIYTSNGVVTG